jgi:hypothetical protein
VRLVIDEYGSGRIVIDGREYRGDVIILPTRVKADWWRQEGHRLHVADLDDVLAAAPDVLIVGTGSAGLMRIADEVRQRLSSEGIELLPDRTPRACDEYNRRCGDARVAAALHLTC